MELSSRLYAAGFEGEMAAQLRVLMSEGSSLSARESLTALGLAGFHVEIVDPNPLCLARFSRWCSRLHVSPRFGADPEGYLAFVTHVLAREHFDVLYPAHEQAYLFAWHRKTIESLTRVALPRFDAFEKMQSKVGFAAVLDELGLPSAPTTIVHGLGPLLAAVRQYPVYVKAAFGTATQGTFCIRSATDLPAAVDAVREVLDQGVLVQEAIPGQLGRAQAVFSGGRLVGFHACLQVEEGVSGGDLIKESVDLPEVRADLVLMGQHLQWHGGLSIDFIVDASGHRHYIDSNPRLAETGNGLASGINLPALVVEVSLGREPEPRLLGAVGVRTFMAIQGLLKAGRTESRRRVAAVMADLVLRRRRFARGSEELTPPVSDWRSLVPLAMVGTALIARPKVWRALSSGTVTGYAASPEVVRFVHASPPD